jgi:hypothetical protein
LEKVAGTILALVADVAVCTAKMNIFSFEFVILTGGVELLLEVLNSCLFGILMLHSYKRLSSEITTF